VIHSLLRAASRNSLTRCGIGLRATELIDDLAATAGAVAKGENRRRPAIDRHPHGLYDSDAVRAAMNLADHFIDAEVAIMRDRWLTHGFTPLMFHLQELVDVRHLSVTFFNAKGETPPQSQ